MDEGIELAKRPRDWPFVVGDEVRPRRVGRSEALRMVGLEFWISAIVL